MEYTISILLFQLKTQVVTTTCPSKGLPKIQLEENNTSEDLVGVSSEVEEGASLIHSAV
jgi:hypothetical protein